MRKTYLRLLSEVRMTYTPGKKQEEVTTDPVAAVFYRPLSILLTPFFVWLGMPANAVTVLSLLLALSIPFIVIISGNYAPYLVAGTGILFQILDCVDGNIARWNSSTSRKGHMFDSLSSMFFWMSYMLGCGLIAYKIDKSEFAAFAHYGGFILTLLYLSQREVEDTYNQYLTRRVTWTPPTSTRSAGISIDQLGKIVEHTYLFIGLPLAETYDCLFLYFAVMAAYQCSLLVTWLVRLRRDIYAYSDPP